MRAKDLRLPLAALLAALLCGACGPRAQAPPQTPPDLSTPRATMEFFLGAARHGDYLSASRALQLEGTGLGRWGARRRAQELQFVLDSQMWVEPKEISNKPSGSPADGEDVEVVGSLQAGDRKVPLKLVRLRDGTWRISSEVVDAVPALYALHGRGWLADQLPPWFSRTRILDVEAWQWLGLLAFLLLSFGVGWLLGWILRKSILLLAGRRQGVRWFVDALTGPGRILLTLIAFVIGVVLLKLAVPVRDVVLRAVVIALILTLSWLAIRLGAYVARLMDARLELTTTDPLRTRGAKTQVMVLRRVFSGAVLVVGTAAVLMQFEALQKVGTSVLASAGVIGIVFGIAAQRTLGTIIAGLQLSLTQPIRVGDHIIVEDEWGTVEDITLSYVVVKTWDLRRLVLPISRFLDQPFQNWTRTQTGLLGTVFVYADYRLPVDRLRLELYAFLHERPEWDGDVANVQVTRVTEQSMELRVVASAANSSEVWNLRCAIREHLVSFLQSHEGGRYLPRLRVASFDEAERGRDGRTRPGPRGPVDRPPR